MGIGYVPRGKLCSFSRKSPTPWAYCDRSGFRGNRKDMVQQLEYNSDGKYWVGLWVHKNYLRKPNPQGLKPNIKGDPYPVDIPLPKRFLTDDQP